MRILNFKIFVVICLLMNVSACYSKKRMDESLIEQKKWPAVEMYINDGGDINWKNRDGLSLLYLLLYAGNSELSVKLIKNGANLTPPTADYTPVLYISAGMGLADVVNTVLSTLKGTDKLQDQRPVDSFVHAASEGYLDVVEIFINYGIKPDDTTLPKTALYYSVYAGHRDVAQYLIDNGADYRFETDDHTSLLIPAVIGGDLELVRFLVEKGLDVNQANDAGDTPLLAAVSGKNKIEVAEYLLSQGANPCVENNEGYSAYNLSMNSETALELKKLFGNYKCE